MMNDLQELGIQIEKFKDLGYVVLHLGEALDEIDQVNVDVNLMIERQEFRTNSKIYSYNDAPRIVEAWTRSESCKSLALNTKVLDFLRQAYGFEPRAFSTINFVRSTQQPLHSDYVHFGTIPHFQLAASWIALEDIHPDSGPIQLVPKSHLWDIFCYGDLDLPIPRSMGQVREQYAIYEDWVRKTLEESSLKTFTPALKKGDALIWSANLLHGSPDCKDNTISRRSQVTHYHFDGTEVFYNPSFSRIKNGHVTDRRVSYINAI